MNTDVLERRNQSQQRRHERTRPNSSPDRELDSMRLARGLGWFSIGLGLAEVLAPRGVAKLIGVRDHRGLLRFMGLREIVSGVAVLSNTQPLGAVQSRVAGDAMDLTFLGAAMVSDKSKRGRVALAAAAVAGVSALDVLCSYELANKTVSRHGVIHFEKSVTINRSPEELYAFWQDFERLPQFMNHLKSVRVTGTGRSHWVANGPKGKSVEWDAEITQEVPNELIAWRSLAGADVDNAGEVRFERATGGRGTIVKVKIDYHPPAGLLGARFAALFGEGPEKQVAVDLRRFKQLIETGEIARTEGQSAGRTSSTSKRFDDFIRT